MNMKIGIAADHGGYELKEQLVSAFISKDIDLLDFGSYKYNKDDDYPDLIYPLAKAVASGELSRGLAICGSGVGASIVANKIPGARAALISDPFAARQGVEDDDMNIICLGGRVLGFCLAFELVSIFLNSSYKHQERFDRRLEKVSLLEFNKFG